MTTSDPNSPAQFEGSKVSQQFAPNLSKRYTFDKIFKFLAWVATWVGLVVLAVLLIDVFIDGLPWFNWQFLTSFPSRKPEQAGLLSALVGSIWLIVLTALFALPVGVASGIFLEEFSADTWYAKVIEINISNLAAVPSIIYGLLSLQVFVRMMEPITGGRTMLSGGLTLALLVVPIVIVATREALRAVPDSIRLAGYALGATRWQVVRDHVLPLAIPGIMTGTILALSRAIGETAPLIMIGALTFIAFLPPLSLEGLQTPFTALPIQTYNWISRPQKDFHDIAAAAIIVLLVVLLTMNAIAVLLRNKFQNTN
jgi:phosphate transport system permease protein